MPNQKKILMLGGSCCLLPVIEAAHRRGLYVITCDYLPDNIAHKYSNEYHNVSVVDQTAVLALAKSLRIDGITSFACDAGALTAAYVQRELGLPGNPYDSVRILQNKDLFRTFLKENGFNVPSSWCLSEQSDISSVSADFEYPVIVKPTDGAGSKGVTKVEDASQLDAAVLNAREKSRSGRIIIEEFIEPVGFPSDCDCFSIEGKLVFSSFSNQIFDVESANPYAPAAYSWPSAMPREQRNAINKDLQRLFSLLDMGTSVYNVESRVGKDGKAYLMEVSPRGGGNRLAEVVRYSTGVDMIDAAVAAAVGDTPVLPSESSIDGFWCEIVLHSNVSGIFKSIDIGGNVRSSLIDELLLVHSGDKVNEYSAGGAAIGYLIFRFDTEAEMKRTVENQNEWLKVIVE